jgi:hypothetical protein
VHDRVARPDADRGPRQRGGRAIATRRRLQAAHLALLVQILGEGGLRLLGEAREGPACRS